MHIAKTNILPVKKMSKYFILFVCLAAIFGTTVTGTKPVAEQKATRIFVQGKIWTADPALPRAEAIAVSEDRILAVGSTREIEAYKSEKTDVEDLKGKFVAPGFNDAHIHFLVPDQVELEESDPLNVIQDKLKSYSKTQSGEWVVGRGW